ncbi:putative ribonuclease H-like domain-containing protein [Tanacetum coccineum]
MDVKSAFLYGKIEEEVYVYQPPGFEDPDFPDRVYKVEKALYGLHQAPRAWYETLLTYLLDNGFQRGKIDKTLFIRRDKGDILLVQVYVDDIIFGSTKKSLCIEFKKVMHKNQDKYVTEILKKFGFTDVKTASTPMETQKLLLKDEDGEEVDVYLYRSMIGSLMYLTSSRPDIMFVVCACARYQVNPKISHLHAVKRIFRYLKGQPKLGLWYPKDSPFDLVAYTDSDYAGASLDRKSTTGGCQFLGSRLISWQCKKQTVVANSTTEAEYVAASSCCGQVLWIQNQLLDYGYNFLHTKIFIDNNSTICIIKNPVFHSKTKHIDIRHHFSRDCSEKKLIQMVKIHTDKSVADLLTKAFDNGIGVNAGDSKLMLLGKVNAARHKLTTAGFADTHNLVALLAKPAESEGFEQIVDFLNAHTIKYALMINPNIYTSCIEQFWATAKKAKRKDTEVPQPSGPTTNVADEAVYEAKGWTVWKGSGPRRQKTMWDTIAQTRFENVSKTSNDSLLTGVNTPQSDEDNLKLKELMELWVKRLEKKNRSKNHGLKRLYKVGLSARIESSEDEGLDEDMFEVNDLEGDEVIVETKVDHEVVVETEVASKDVNLSVDEVTLAQALAALKSAKPKTDKVMLQEPEQGTITTIIAATTITAANTRPKAKGLVIHEEEQATTPTVSSQKPLQVKVQDKGKGIMVEEPLKMKKKDQITKEEHFTAKRAEEKRNRPPTRAQQRSIMCTYLKNMEGWKPKSLKNKSFANIQELFDKAFKRVNTFVDYRTELMEESSKKAEVIEEISKKAEAKIAQESSSKRAREALGEESSKKQKVEEDKESEELKQCLEIIPNDRDDVTIDATPLSTKSPTIVDYKIYKEGKKSYFQIIRADGNS